MFPCLHVRCCPSSDLRLAGNDLRGLLDTPANSLSPSHGPVPQRDMSGSLPRLQGVLNAAPATGTATSSCQAASTCAPCTTAPAHIASQCDQGDRQDQEDQKGPRPAAPSSPPTVLLLEPGLAATLARLTRLDVSHCSGLGPQHLELLLTSCTSLTDLDVSGCRSLAGSWQEEVARSCSHSNGSCISTSEGGQTHGASALRGAAPHQLMPCSTEGPEGSSLAVEGNQPSGSAAAAKTPVHGLGVGRRLPRLRRLCAGWGMSARLLHALVDAAGPELQVWCKWTVEDVVCLQACCCCWHAVVFCVFN